MTGSNVFREKHYEKSVSRVASTGEVICSFCGVNMIKGEIICGVFVIYICGATPKPQHLPSLQKL